MRGFEDFRPGHDFAMRAIAAGADNASALGRRLSVTKQAAAKTIALLKQRGYVGIDLDIQDGRRKRLQLTPRGYEVLHTGEEILNRLRHQWAEQIGSKKLAVIETALTDRLQASPSGFVDLGWLAQENT